MTALLSTLTSRLWIIAVIGLLGWVWMENIQRNRVEARLAQAEADLAERDRQISALHDTLDGIQSRRVEEMAEIAQTIQTGFERRTETAAIKRRIIPDETLVPAALRVALDGLRSARARSAAGDPERAGTAPDMPGRSGAAEQ